MKFTVTVATTFACSLERAFKTPMLCDIAKVHTGYGLMPRITHCTDDSDWGKPGSSKKVFAAKSITQKCGYASRDQVIERIENKYWKIKVSDFQSWVLGFNSFVGEWSTTQLEPEKIKVEYRYTLHGDTVLFYPLQWLFARIFWPIYMKRVLENIRIMAYRKEPYQYA